MNTQKDEKWLDELISRSIDTASPEFDVEKWKKKYPGEFQMLCSHHLGTSRSRLLWPRLAGLAAAAVIIIAVGLMFVYTKPGEHPEVVKIEKVEKSPGELMTVMSLNIAYRNGGMEAVDRQYQKAFEMLGPRQTSISVQQLLAELDGT